MSLRSTLYAAEDVVAELSGFILCLGAGWDFGRVVERGRKLTDLLGLEPLAYVTPRDRLELVENQVQGLRERLIFLEGFARGADDRISRVEQENKRLDRWCIELQRRLDE